MNVIRLFVVIALLLAVTPALAQDSTTHTVAFDGFRFSFEDTVASRVTLQHYPGDAPEIGPGGADAPHLQFELSHVSREPVPEAPPPVVGSVRVYDIAAMAAYQGYMEQVERLKALLAERPDLSPYLAVVENLTGNTLPFLPILPAGQLLRARAEYVDTPAASGISYIVVYRQDVAPLLSNDFHWTFQGISADGSRFISATLQVSTPLFPDEVPADYDWNRTEAEWIAEFNEGIATLNAAGPSDFSPSLDDLDALVSTLAFGE
ncbi:MAG: hypothetical protein AB1435_18050 [Chloroflexota bacterium]